MAPDRAAAKRPAPRTWYGLHPVPYAAVWVAGDAERHRIAAEPLRQPAPEHLVDRHSEPFGFLVFQEHQQPRPPVVVGGPLGVEPSTSGPAPISAAAYSSPGNSASSSGRTTPAKNSPASRTPGTNPPTPPIMPPPAYLRTLVSCPPVPARPQACGSGPGSPPAARTASRGR